MNEMIQANKPYGYVNINEIRKIFTKLDRFFFIDNYGIWEINEQTYHYLESRGIKEYRRYLQWAKN